MRMRNADEDSAGGLGFFSFAAALTTYIGHAKLGRQVSMIFRTLYPLAFTLAAGPPF